MATNKMYRVERIDINSRISDIVYSGRIRDCRKSLANIADAYKERGYAALNTGFALFIYAEEAPKANWTYIIRETK